MTVRLDLSFDEEGIRVLGLALMDCRVKFNRFVVCDDEQHDQLAKLPSELRRLFIGRVDFCDRLIEHLREKFVEVTACPVAPKQASPAAVAAFTKPRRKKV